NPAKWRGRVLVMISGRTGLFRSPGLRALRGLLARADQFCAGVGRRRHSTFGGSGRPCARRAVRKCILATLARPSGPCLVANSLAAASTAADAPLGNFAPDSFSKIGRAS